MFNECPHILTSGHKCKAAALRGKAFCYYPLLLSKGLRFVYLIKAEGQETICICIAPGSRLSKLRRSLKTDN